MYAGERGEEDKVGQQGNIGSQLAVVGLVGNSRGLLQVLYGLTRLSKQPRLRRRALFSSFALALLEEAAAALRRSFGLLLDRYKPELKICRLQYQESRRRSSPVGRGCQYYSSSVASFPQTASVSYTKPARNPAVPEVCQDGPNKPKHRSLVERGVLKREDRKRERAAGLAPVRLHDLGVGRAFF